MSGAAFILIVTLCVAALFCAAFAAIAYYDRRLVSARWFALTFVSGIVYALAEFALPHFTNLRVGVFTGHAAFLLTLTLLNVGLAKRYDVKLPSILIGVTFVVSLIVSALIQELPRQSFARLFLYQAPYFAMQAIGAYIVYTSRNRRRLDNVLAGFIAISSLQYLSKPFIAVALGNTGANPAEYLTTTYAAISQTMGVVMVVATALLLLASLASEILTDVTMRSETDMLSSLLNRRGFERRLSDLVGRHAKSGLPLSLVICDLDHFKAVNDTYGHAAGDRLIALFAATLKDGAVPHHVLGRVGGEEFAVILPGSNLGAGRLFAESIRVLFCNRRPDYLPSGVAVSSSFGVAELAPGEAPSSLFERADAALYEAKRAGRDCVRTSAGRATVGGTAYSL